MKIEKIKLWENTPGMCGQEPELTAYIPNYMSEMTDNLVHKGAILICPGGGYAELTDAEGVHYAEFFAVHGFVSFVLKYRIAPYRFPLPLLDARRAMRLIRRNADKYGIDKNKIAIMGSSAGGHLAALTSTYTGRIAYEGIDEVDYEDYMPNAQILCYPVIELDTPICHIGSGQNLLGENYKRDAHKLIPSALVMKDTPKTFIWHSFADNAVDVRNSLNYAAALKECGVPCEMHIFPDGTHGHGLQIFKDSKVSQYLQKWSRLLLEWLEYNEY